MVSRKKPKLTVFVSSSVYGRETLLTQICAALKGFGFEPWNSHIGSVPVVSKLSTYESCIQAVERCDMFFCLISERYGSGIDESGANAVTHLELSRAIALDKPRLILAHENVVNARRLLMDLGYGKPEKRKELKLRKGASIIDDLRLIDMFEEATFEHLPISQRKGNWVQKYRNDAEALNFVEHQFHRHDDILALVEDWRSANPGVK